MGLYDSVNGFRYYTIPPPALRGEIVNYINSDVGNG